MTIISLSRVWIATSGIFITVVLGWMAGIVSDEAIEGREFVWLPAVALTVDSVLRRLWPQPDPFPDPED